MDTAGSATDDPCKRFGDPFNPMHGAFADGIRADSAPPALNAKERREMAWIATASAEEKDKALVRMSRIIVDQGDLLTKANYKSEGLQNELESGWDWIEELKEQLSGLESGKALEAAQTKIKELEALAERQLVIIHQLTPEKPINPDEPLRGIFTEENNPMAWASTVWRQLGASQRMWFAESIGINIKQSGLKAMIKNLDAENARLKEQLAKRN